MENYLLFIDTETSGLPKDWRLGYDAKDNWPFLVQIAWEIYTKEGVFVKAVDHYVHEADIVITDIARDIHGLNPEFLKKHGKSRAAVMQSLQQDLLKYKPLLVAHFMQLDAHMIALGFHRASMENTAKNLRQFCTMQATAPFIKIKPSKFLNLEDLYQRLFQEPLIAHHNALIDARATARCFFEMLETGDISEKIIQRQQLNSKSRKFWRIFPWMLLFSLFSALIPLISHL